MEEKPSTPTTRPGVEGVDIFKIAGQSISGWNPSFKTGDPGRVRMPYTSKLENRLSLYLDYHPHVRTYQRGDATKSFVEAHNLTAPLGTPYRINYEYEGGPHVYLPDFVGTLCDGKLLIAEAGVEEEKLRGRALAKAEAANRVVKAEGGLYWIGTEKNLPLSRHYNLLYLHARRESFKTYSEIASALLAHWPWGEPRTVKDFIRLLGDRWSDFEVEAAVWKMAGDAAAEGRLLVDLTDVELSLSTPLALLKPGAPPILPPPLPSSLEKTEQGETEIHLTMVENEDGPIELESAIPGPTFDDSSLGGEERITFNNNLSAVQEVLSGRSLRAVAEEKKMALGKLSRLVKRVQEFGQVACVPYGVYHRERSLRTEFQNLIRRLYTQAMRPSIQAIYEDHRIKALAKKLTKREGKPVKSPSYWQVYYFIQSISKEPAVAEARSGLKHPQREPQSLYSYVLSIPSAALVCQVDEHTFDQYIVAQDGTPITRRVHEAVLVDVKTGAILAGVLALDSLKEEDYMRLIKQAMEPKDRLVRLYECTNPWPCYAKPALILHDRGKIFTSERATQVLVDRFKITSEQTPPFTPSLNGTAEAVFAWMTDKFEHRMPGTTKANPEDRGAYDSLREAEKAGITLDLLEKYFYQAIVDDYMQDWNDLRRQTPAVLWQHAVQEKGVSRWQGSNDDLKLLLMKSQNRKNPATGRYALKPHQGLSFLGRRYNSKPLLNQLRGKEIDIYYDRRDISVIYIFEKGELRGEAYCTAFPRGLRVSIWEADAMRKADKEQKKLADAVSLEGRQRIQKQAGAGKKIHSLETKRLEKERQYDLQRLEIHPDHVQATLNALAQQDTPPTPLPASQVAKSQPSPEPEDDTEGGPVIHLPIRRWEKRHD